MNRHSELALDNLVHQTWWDASSWTTHRTMDGQIIVLTDSEMYIIGTMGAITRNTFTGSPEAVILD